jgi:hypothetical protein
MKRNRQAAARVLHSAGLPVYGDNNSDDDDADEVHVAELDVALNGEQDDDSAVMLAHGSAFGQSSRNTVTISYAPAIHRHEVRLQHHGVHSCLVIRTVPRCIQETTRFTSNC